MQDLVCDKWVLDPLVNRIETLDIAREPKGDAELAPHPGVGYPAARETVTG